MAEEKKADDATKIIDDLTNRLKVQEAKLEALEAVESAPAAESVSSAKPKAVALTGETFKVGGGEYKVKFPVVSFNGKVYSEADILEDKAVQKALVEGGYGVIEKV